MSPTHTKQTSTWSEEIHRRECFLTRRKHGDNVAQATLIWYEQSFKRFEKCVTEADYLNRIEDLKYRGLSEASVNTALRAINAYLRWAQASFVLAFSHEKTRKIETLTPEQIEWLLEPITEDANGSETRIQTLAVVILDTGLEISEALPLRWMDVDLTGLKLEVIGRRDRPRSVPMSQTCADWLLARKQKSSRLREEDESHELDQVDEVWLQHVYVFATRTGEPLGARNAQRDLRKFCESRGVEGIRCSPHTLRDTFAVNYLKSGGRLEVLQNILGHSNPTITQRYMERAVTGEGTAHERFSSLRKRRIHKAVAM